MAKKRESFHNIYDSDTSQNEKSDKFTVFNYFFFILSSRKTFTTCSVSYRYNRRHRLEARNLWFEQQTQ